jgi:hypothetical protein
MKIFNLTTSDEVRSHSCEIKNSIENNGAAIIRGLFNPLQIRNHIPNILSTINNQEILGTTTGSRETPRKNNLKWSVGGHSGAQTGNARLMITIYNPLNDDDVFSFHDIFKELINLRDLIHNSEHSSSDENLQNGAFNACRFQVYPRGGGFMLGHIDYEASSSFQAQRLPLYQLVLLITQRGIDFIEGGAYIKHNKNMVDIEDLGNSGDVVIYNGASFHGVSDIDPFLPLNTNDISGRVVGMVTIYK